MGRVGQAKRQVCSTYCTGAGPARGGTQQDGRASEVDGGLRGLAASIRFSRVESGPYLSDYPARRAARSRAGHVDWHWLHAMRDGRRATVDLHSPRSFDVRRMLARSSALPQLRLRYERANLGRLTFRPGPWCGATGLCSPYLLHSATIPDRVAQAAAHRGATPSSTEASMPCSIHDAPSRPPLGLAPALRHHEPTLALSISRSSLAGAHLPSRPLRSGPMAPATWHRTVPHSIRPSALRHPSAGHSTPTVNVSLRVQPRPLSVCSPSIDSRPRAC